MKPKIFLQMRGLEKKLVKQARKKGGAKKPKAPQNQERTRQGNQKRQELGEAMATLFGCGYGPEGDTVHRSPYGELSEVWGPPEEGVPEGTKCKCLSGDRSSCKKHPSREKVRTGRFIQGWRKIKGVCEFLYI